jgi:uncharacterized BrkB/YihY/UPF0761 family membrane protein
MAIKKEDKERPVILVEIFSLVVGVSCTVFCLFIVFSDGLTALFDVSSKGGRMRGIPVILFLVLGFVMIYFPLKNIYDAKKQNRK